jgi:flagellar M-ring protein FliF
LQGLIQTLRGLGAVRLAAMGAVAVALVVFFVFMSSKLSSTDNAILFGNLDPSESSKIIGKLETMGVPYELKADGHQIWVPSDKVLRLRMNMAEEGLPSGGSAGYELFDRADTLGSTNFVQNVNLIRALEGELARTIRSIGTVAEARVHLVMPKRELFSRTEREPTASVLIRARGTERLTKSQVRAIQHLVAAAVPGLSPTRISVVDARGELLARGSGSDAQGAAATGESADDSRRAYEDRMTRIIEELLENSVGAGKVRAEVTAEMDFDRITTNRETYDPNGQVVRSTQSVEETSNDSDSKSKPAVTVRNNLPDANTQQGGGANKSESATSRTEETVNYEISKTVQNHVREVGTLKRVSVAVLVDGTYSMQSGKPVYQPRSPEEIENLAKLVRSAVGYDEKRGDKVELINMQFAAGPRDDEKIEAPLFGLTKADYFRIAELLVLAVVAILVLLLVIRPIVQRTLEALPTALSREQERALLADQSVGAPALTGPAGTGTDQSQEEEMIDVAQVEGRVRASTIKKIGEIVEHHPEETVSIIREWLYQDA